MSFRPAKLEFPGYVPGMVPVCAHTIVPNGVSNYGADALRSWKQGHEVLLDSTNIVLEFANWYANATTEVVGPQDETLRVGLEMPNGTIHPVTFGGHDEAVIFPGATVRSDPLPIKVTAGTKLYSRVTATVPVAATGYVWNTTSLNRTNDAGGQTNTGGYAFGPVQDNARSGTNYSGGGNQAIGPIRIMGYPLSAKSKCVGLIGDSIMQGANASAAYVGGFEWAMIQQSLPFVKVCKGSETAATFADSTKSGRRLEMLRGCTHAIVEYGTNDINGGATLGTMQTNLLAVYALLQGIGINRIWQTTITPRTTSTDSWATTTNQTPVSGFAPAGVRSQLNAWIRANTANISGYIEVGDACESARDSGVWAVGATTDGTHPSDSAHVAITNAVPVF